MNSPSKKSTPGRSRDDPDDSKPPAKKSRRDGDGDGDDDGGNSTTPLPLDALLVVMEFLPPKDLLHTALSCKALRDMVTTKMVVKSALIHGGHAKKTMEELHCLMSCHSIHVPSPLRLLRLSNGKRCEFCNIDKVNHVRPGIGVFACWECVTNKHRSGRYAAHWRAGVSERCSLTKVWKLTWVRYAKNSLDRAKYDAIFDHPRVASNEYGRNHYLWSHHRSDLAGERVGPIVAWRNVDEMSNHFGNVNELNAGLDEYLTNNLNAPAIELYNEFNETYTDMQQRAREAAQEREQMKRAKTAKTKDNKLAKAKKILDELEALIDEPFRECAMKRVENPHFKDANAKMTNNPCVCFETVFVDELLNPYVLSPSKMKKATMKELSETINGKLRMISDKKLLAFEFLSDSDAFENTLKGFLLSKLTGIQALFDAGKSERPIFRNCIDKRFFALLEEDKYLEAVAHAMRNKFGGCMLLATEPTAALARDAKERYEAGIIDNIADCVWTRCLRESTPRELALRYDRSFCHCKEHYAQAFSASQEKFEQALSALEEYSTWLAGREQVPAIHTEMLRKVARLEYHFDYLLERNFESLHRLTHPLGRFMM